MSVPAWHEGSHRERKVCSSWGMELRATLEVSWNNFQNLSISQYDKEENKYSRGNIIL